jgi:hypothetical protein
VILCIKNIQMMKNNIYRQYTKRNIGVDEVLTTINPAHACVVDYGAIAGRRTG